MTIVSTTAAESTEIKFRDDLVDLSTKLKAEFVIDNASGALTLPADAFFKNAPELVTEETYAAVRHYTDLFNNAATKAGSEATVEVLKDNKDLQQVTLVAPIWKKDGYEGVFKRTGTSRHPGTGETSNYTGHVGVGRINTVSTRTKTEWQGIKSNLRALAEAAGL